MVLTYVSVRPWPDHYSTSLGITSTSTTAPPTTTYVPHQAHPSLSSSCQLPLYEMDPNTFAQSIPVDNEITINFGQLEYMADALLRQEFPETSDPLPFNLPSARPLQLPHRNQPSTASKKAALDAFLPKSLLSPIPHEPRSLQSPTMEALMKESAVTLRTTSKRARKKAVSEADRNYFIALQAQWEKVLAINAIRRSVSMDMVETILYVPNTPKTHIPVVPLSYQFLSNVMSQWPTCAPPKDQCVALLSRKQGREGTFQSGCVSSVSPLVYSCTLNRLKY